MRRAVVWAAEAERVKTPVAERDQSSPPVRAKVVEAFVLPKERVSAVVELVAMFMVSPPLFVTPPMSMVFVFATSQILSPPVPVSMVVADEVLVLPRVMVFMAPPVPREMVSFEASVQILMAPVVPEFRVRAVAAPVVILPAP